MDSNLFLSEGLIGAIIGAAGTYFFTHISELQKSRKQQNDTRRLILLDLSRQINSLNVMEKVFKELIELVEQGNVIKDVYSKFSMYHNTDVYDSISNIDQMNAFDVFSFNDLKSFYIELKEFYKVNPYQIIQVYHEASFEIKKGNLSGFQSLTDLNDSVIGGVKANLTNINHFKKSINGFILANQNVFKNAISKYKDKIPSI